MSRDDEVLEVMRRLDVPWTAAAMTRALNVDRECQWAPVLPPAFRQQAARVPEISRDRVNRVLKRLLRNGRIQRVGMSILRKPTYTLNRIGAPTASEGAT